MPVPASQHAALAGPWAGDVVCQVPSAPRQAIAMARLVAWLGLLAGEVLWLTCRFDAGTIQEDGSLLTSGFALAPQLGRAAIALLAAVCVMIRARLPGYGRGLLRHSAGDLRNRLWAGGQIAAFAVFAGLTALLFEQHLTPAVATLLGIAWLAAGGATLGCWLLALAPARAWLRLARAESRALALGTGIALGAVALGQTAQQLWSPLGAATLHIVALLLHCLFADVVLDAAARIVGTSAFQVQIAPQCSGYEGIGLISVFLGAFCSAFHDRLRFPQAWLLWPLGILAMWLGNALRIALLIAVGATFSPQIALGGFHSQAGWIFFNLVALALTGAALRMPFFAISDECRNAPRRMSPTTAYLAPFLTLMTANLVAAAFTTEFDWVYPIKVLAAAVSLALCWPAIRASVGLHAQTLAAELLSALLAGAIGAGVFVLWIVTADLNAESSIPVSLAHCSTLWGSAWIVFRVLGSSVTVPLVEELAFRGYLLRRLASERFESLAYAAAPWWSVLASSLLFGLMHQRWLAGAAAGLAYALAARRRNCLRDAVLAHAVTNALIAATVLGCGAWGLW